MNRKTILHYISLYKEHFDEINTQELYKWKAVKHFKDHFNLNAADFAANIEEALSKTQNLLAAENYLPKNLIVDNAKKTPEVVRRLFADLYAIDEGDNPKDWVENFREEFKELSERNFPGLNHYQDHRAVMVYLNLEYPERYFFYKYGIAKEFIRLIDYPGYIKKGDAGNIGIFNEMGRQVLAEVEKDQELIAMHSTRYTDETYQDNSLHILTQDIMYAAVRHLPNITNDTGKAFSVLSVDENFDPQANTDEGDKEFRGSKTDYFGKQKNNKRIGDAGELWVMKYEEELLRKNGREKWIKNINHIAKTEGDGLGYDILSKQLDGELKYIEVKATTGSKDATFYLTKNEVDKSKQEKANYYLYRVYQLDPSTMQGHLAIRNGDLSDLCSKPVVFEVKKKT